MLRIIGFFLLGALSMASAWAAPGDAAVLQAQQAFVARKLADLERAARDVPADHVLSPYVEYWRLMLSSRTEMRASPIFWRVILAAAWLKPCAQTG
jgi:soluble lytic murein transglycosylase